MPTLEQADLFAKEWIESWNSHDLERIVSHWTDDCVFTSPYVSRLMGEPTGKVRGKEALRAYWARGLAAFADLHFTLESLFVGHDSIVIGYRNQRGQLGAEWIRIGADGRAIEGAAHRVGGF